MRVTLKAAVLMALAVGTMLTAGVRAQQSSRALYERARLVEETGQKLAEAIKLYEQVVAQAKTDRPLAAEALLRMAECYRKGGDAQARKIYERIVREYGDQQKAVSLARTRLEIRTTARASGIVNKQVWVGPNVDTEGTVSPDGRYLSFVDWDTGDLAVHDLTTGADRRLTNKGTWQQSTDYAEESTISRDGGQIAYSWFDNAKGHYVARVIKFDAVGIPAARTIFDNEEVSWIGPYDWSPDGRWLAVSLARKDRTGQIGLLSPVDGTLKVLKSVDWQGATKMQFSPDGKTLAYDLAIGDGRQRDIFLMTSDGSREVAVVNHPDDDAMVGWSPNGKWLLFTSDRGGSMGLWAVSVANGRAAETPTLLKPEFGPAHFGISVTSSGTLVYGLRRTTPNVFVAPVDFETGRLLSPPRQAVEEYRFANRGPDWSPDGKSMVFISERSRRLSALSIFSVEKAEIVRQVQPKMTYLARPRWAPDGTFTLQGVDLKGRQGIYRVDPQTGDATPIVLSAHGQFVNQHCWTPDGRTLLYRRAGQKTESVVARDVAAGTERELIRRENLNGIEISPDGRLVTYIERDRTSKTSTLNVMPVEGGAAKEIFRIADPITMFGWMNWMPDGKRVIFATNDASNGAPKRTVWTVPASGGKPLEVAGLGGTDNSIMAALRIHPDGRQVAYNVGTNTFEVWTLENFLPGSGTTSSKVGTK